MKKEVTIKEKKYHIGKLSALKQFHIVRRLAPLLSGFKELVNLKDFDALNLEDEKTLTLLMPLAEAVAAMSDTDADYIIKTSLAVCERHNAGGGSSKILASDGSLMFEDIDMTAMLTLTAHVIGGSLQDFFDSLPKHSLPT